MVKKIATRLPLNGPALFMFRLMCIYPGFAWSQVLLTGNKNHPIRKDAVPRLPLQAMSPFP